MALIPENDAERVELEKTRGIRSQPSAIPNPRFHIEVNEMLMQGLRDRLDGLALLAEAYSFSDDHPSGRFREYVRLFELAFAMPATQMGKKLTQFLQEGGYGYERREIEEWLVLRNPSSHADGRKTPHFALWADFLPVIDRMEQAAIDVLFNKTDWHNSSRTRRQLLHPKAATTSKGGNLGIMRGQTVDLRFRLMDTYGAFPHDSTAILEKPPENWWAKRAQPEQNRWKKLAVKSKGATLDS